MELDAASNVISETARDLSYNVHLCLYHRRTRRDIRKWASSDVGRLTMRLSFADPPFRIPRQCLDSILPRNGLC